MVLGEGGLNSEQVSLMRPLYIEQYILILKQAVFIPRVVLIFKWSLLLYNFAVIFIFFFQMDLHKDRLYHGLMVVQPAHILPPCCLATSLTLSPRHTITYIPMKW